MRKLPPTRHKCDKCERVFIGSLNTDCGSCESLEVIEHVASESWTIIYPILFVVLLWATTWVVLVP